MPELCFEIFSVGYVTHVGESPLIYELKAQISELEVKY